MSLNDCLECDINDFIDYMEFDLVRNKLEEQGGVSEWLEQI